jgi:hypothetical protein
VKAKAAIVSVLAGAGGYAALQRLGRTYGATADERRRDLPGDELIVAPMAVTTHATTIAAPSERIWPWLVQMGWHRGGWYTAEWVDRLLFPANWPSATTIVPGLQHLDVGDRVPDGPPESGCAFIVTGLEPGRHLVLRSSTHLPPSWTERFGAWLDWTWAFVLDDQGDGRTRFVLRSRVRAGPPWVAALYVLVIVPADFVMSRQMLRGLRSRAEAHEHLAVRRRDG